MRLGALLRSWFLEPDQLAKAKRELALGRAIVTATRRGPRPSLAYPDRIVDVNPVFRDALFDGLARYVEDETSRVCEGPDLLDVCFHPRGPGGHVVGPWYLYTHLNSDETLSEFDE